MKKTYVKPVTLKKEQNRVHCGSCGLTHDGVCGKAVQLTP